MLIALLSHELSSDYMHDCTGYRLAMYMFALLSTNAKVYTKYEVPCRISCEIHIAIALYKILFCFL